MNETRKEILGENSTYIFKGVELTATGIKLFIFNRSSNFVERLYFDKYVNWFEIDKMDVMYGDDLTCLEHLPIDNTNHRNQGKINKIKKKYIEEYSALDENSNSVTLCNLLFNKSSKNYRKLWRQHYNEVINSINNMSTDDIYKIIRDDIYFKPIKHMLRKPKHVIFRNNYIDIKTRVVMIIFKDYLNDKIRRNCRLPFVKGQIHKTIKAVVEKSKEFKVEKHHKKAQ